MTELLRWLQSSSALSEDNASFIEDLYSKYLRDPDSVDPSWQKTFAAVPGSLDDLRPSLASVPPMPADQPSLEHRLRKQTAVDRLIDQYRTLGHQAADNNPLKCAEVPAMRELEPASHGLDDRDLDQPFYLEVLRSREQLPLREILAMLRATYCGPVGAEYMHIMDTEIKSWLQNRLESTRGRWHFDPQQKRWLLRLLTAAEGIEKYLHRKYVGQKRFSLEGGESLIPLLDEIIQRSGSVGTREIVIGMAHRGRLNVLVNILGKKPCLLFREFEGLPTPDHPEGSGDVKYHMGFSSDVETPGGPVHLALAFNPSHLEIIGPVVEGSVRARQDRFQGDVERQVLPVIIHGDAAFAGQGVVMETLNMAETRAYTTGGTIHIVVNNQIGFTTSNPFDARSTLYCTDVANMVQAPVFHVNGDDPEAVLFVTRLAVDYRMEFNRDVVIDLICYRRHGHNEADEPAVTQPLMYRFIRQHPSVRHRYAEQLISEGVISSKDAEAMDEAYQTSIAEGDEAVMRPTLVDVTNYIKTRWNQFLGAVWTAPCDTSLPLETLRQVGERMLHLPPQMELHARAHAILQSRLVMATGEQPIDWGYAENLAYATLLWEGHNVRLTGQDVGRGTFFHRHATLYDQNTGNVYIPLQHLGPQQGRFCLYDSLLSEEGVLGFEYGYSTSEPDTLVIWEAQFGDFANNAQVVIDQFISSGETKWGRLSGLVMLLPHGYEGQGPEHSSARIERYLQLCAEQNMQVCVPTTPAQMFHLLRRQLLRPFRRPLIVMTPKSLLRHKMAVSNVEELTAGRFHNVIGECDPLDRNNVSRVVLCSGKIFYDLLEYRRKENLDHVAIIRIEQLYPFPSDEFMAELTTFPNARELVWCQDEPENQGAWHQIKHRFLSVLGSEMALSYAGRPMSAAPAVGHFKRHIEQQKKVIETALLGSRGHEEPVGIVHAYRSQRAQSS
jgi:2-oxoglutarate dehydrogenase E1 component